MNSTHTPGANKELVIARASDAYWTIDISRAKSGEGFTYDWKSTFVSGDQARTETILNRPLRGDPYVPIDIAYQMHLVAIASTDLNGFCVPVQMQLCVARRYQPGEAGQQERARHLEPTHTIDEMKAFLEQIHERVHGPRPGAVPTAHR